MNARSDTLSDMARKTGSHSDITGPKVRDAALRLIAQHGYAAVSMRQIASEVGVQAGALYLYTKDKQSLLFDLMRTHLEDLMAAWDSVKKPSDPMARLEVFARFHVSHHLDKPESVFVAYMELRNLEPENFEIIQGLRRAYEAELEDILCAGFKSGAFKVTDCRVTTMALIAMLTGVNTWYRDGGRLSRDRIEQIYWNLVRRAVTDG
jgi:AcrR family transcriptional regulator